jgi:hypothetical protein
METEVMSRAEQQIDEQRNKIIDEAIAAFAETRNALRALEDNNTQEALAALERASGKLNIILARDPNLALAPIDVEVSLYDVYNTVDAIRNAVLQAQDFLDVGEVQKARRLIRNLASEIVLSVTNLPLATYPDAIKAVTPLIDQGKIDEAKVALETALNTTVVIDSIIPLPLLRADMLLVRAEKLAEKEGRSEEENNTLARLLNQAREQLEFGETLGYGSKEDYQKFYTEIEEIENKTKGGKAGKGWFGTIRDHLSKFTRSIFGDTSQQDASSKAGRSAA